MRGEGAKSLYGGLLVKTGVKKYYTGMGWKCHVGCVKIDMSADMQRVEW